jgi:hypothetical protein
VHGSCQPGEMRTVVVLQCFGSVSKLCLDWNDLHLLLITVAISLCDWGCRGANAKSCQSLLDRAEQNDPLLVDLVILPSKIFGAEEVDRLVELIGTIC